jgi:hypothetical protein
LELVDVADEDWAIAAVIGFLLGISIGIGLYWFFTCSSQAPTYVQAKTYSNVEEWEIVRDPETGRTLGVRVKRTAKEGPNYGDG